MTTQADEVAKVEGHCMSGQTTCVNEPTKLESVVKAFKTELDPTPEQVLFFRTCCEANEKSYNWMLAKYRGEYAKVTGIVENALKQIALFDIRDYVSVVLDKTFIGIGPDEKPPNKKKHIAEKKGRKRERHEMDADREWFDQYVKRPEVIQCRSEKVIEFAAKWREYLIALFAWRDLPKDEQKKAKAPKRPTFRARLFGLPDGEIPHLHCKKLWRDYVKMDKELAHLGGVPGSVYDSSCTALGLAFSRWITYLKKSPAERKKVPVVGKPKPHKDCDSFTVTSSNGSPIGERFVTVVNLGEVKLKEHGYLPVGRYTKGMTISRRCGGTRWFVSVLGEFVAEQYPKGRPSAGIDVGIVNYAAVQPSEGPVEYVDNPEFGAQSAKRLRMLQRSSARKMGAMLKEVEMPDGTLKLFPPRHVQVRRALVDGRKVVDRKNKQCSKRWERSQVRVSRCHFRVSNQWKHFLHVLTTYLTKRFGMVAVESLDIKMMMSKQAPKHSNARLRGRIGDSRWFEFIRQLTYKGKWHGSEVVAVDRWFKSTLMCSGCGSLVKIHAATRMCHCPDCGLIIDRDENAAKNILSEAIQLQKRDSGTSVPAAD